MPMGMRAWPVLLVLAWFGAEPGCQAGESGPWSAVAVADPSFEAIPAGPLAGRDWVVPQGPYGPASWASISAEQAHTGAVSLRIEDTSHSKGFFVRCAAHKALPGSRYRGSVHTYNVTGTSRIYLEFFSRTGERIANVLKESRVKGKWSRLEVEFTAPWAAATVDVGLYSTVGNVGVAFYDDASLTVQPLALNPPTFAPLAPGETAMDVGTTLQLFVDERLIDRVDNAALKLNPPRPGEVALHMEKPWEGVTSSYPCVIKDGDRYRLWYRVSSEGQPKNWNMTAYAESADGIQWTRPSLGIVEFQGSKDNNIVWPTPGHSGHNLCVFLDGNPAAANSERYKAIMHGPVLEGKRATICGLVSPDGIHWEPAQPEPLLIAPEEDRHFDSHNQCFWDGARGRYAIYARGWREGVRGIRMATSGDFRAWSGLRYIDLGDTPAEHLYTSAAHPYFRRPDLCIMFPSRFMPERQLDPQWPRPGMSDVVLLTSYDGLHFQRTFMEAFIRPGLDPRNWTDRALYPGPATVPIGAGDLPKEMSFYYFENYRHPSNRIRRAILRVDGFTSVHVGYPKGEFVTKPIVFQGSRLVLNYATSGAGSIRVEVQNARGEPLSLWRAEAGEELYGDELARPYRWLTAQDLAPCAGKPVRLRFVMQDADLYSIRFE